MKYRTPAATGAWPNTDDDNNKSRIKTSSSSGGGDPTRQRRRSSRRSQQSQDVKNNRNNNSKQQRDANKPPPHVRSFNSKLKTKMSPPPLGSARQNSIFASLQQDSILRAVQKSGLGASMNTGKGSNGTPESPNAGRRNVFSSMRKNSQGTKLNSIQFKPEETDRLPDSDVSNSNDGSGGSSLESLGVGISNNSKSEVMDLRPSVALAGLEDSLLSLNRPSDHDVKSSSESDDKKTNDPKVSKPSRLLRPARGLFGFMRGSRDHHKAMEVDFGHSGNHSDNSHSKNSGKGHGSDGSGSYKRVVTLMMEEGTKLGKDGRQRDRNIDGSFISDGSSLASSKWISGGEDDDGDDYKDLDSQNSDDTELSPLREAKRKRRKLRHRQAKMARRFANVLAAAIVAIAAVAVMIPYIFDDEIEVFGFVMVFDKWLVKPNLRTGEVIRAPQQGEEYPEQTDVRQLPFHEDVMDSEEHVDIMAGGNADNNNNNNNNNDEMIIGRENYRQRQARLKRERTQRIRERRERELALKQRQEEELADLRANRERKLAQDRETRVRQNMEERALREREREERVQAKMRRDQRVLLRQGQRRQPRLPSFQWYEEELQRRGGLRADAN
eukprot:CAMPEP_0183766038 /NCGR_PEP_ID=MMETSP0739-20130205/11298_1 /TAXON_ID=385413 /ORGANISM="Thalassiosira miniscula, Strain CCMP1093" /LENGTH=610 /DNA_ID=CAMNT_0026004773 /DNA_START=136 /DNA_END=1968 /DNA_ORIENTATION=+